MNGTAPSSAPRRRSGPKVDASAGYDLCDLDVVIVEKQVPMRSMMRRILRELGIEQIRDTGDPHLALDMMRDTSPDLVLTDWSPSLDGMDFLKRIRDADISPDPFVPVIVVSANTGVDHICTARDLGMTEYLAKPVSAALIYSRIRSVIEHHRRFVRTDGFFGPDRRRRRVDFKGPDLRDAEAAPTDGVSHMTPSEPSEPAGEEARV